MAELEHLEGISCRFVETDRGRYHVLEAGPPDGVPVVLVHGNVSSATFWEEVMLSLPEDYHAIAYDQRGYGESETLPVDATRGMGDFSDDLHSLVETLGLDTFHLAGHSMGGNVVMEYALAHPERLRSLTLVAPGSPYGFAGAKGEQGHACRPDYAGSGGGIVNPEFVERITENDRSDESDFSPRRVLRLFYGKAPFEHEREDILVESMLRTATGEENYPGDAVPSDHWPGVAPGTKGVGNALSPKYCDQSALPEISPKPPILWIRGAEDQIVSNRSMFEPGTLGTIGAIPDYPGEEVFPPQPMEAQMRSVLEEYRANGGSYREEVIEDAGHCVYLEKLDEFTSIWLPFLRES